VSGLMFCIIQNPHCMVVGRPEQGPTLPSLTPSPGVLLHNLRAQQTGSWQNVSTYQGPLGDSLHDPPLHVLTDF
jgi:hypothetical protein